MAATENAAAVFEFSGAGPAGSALLGLWATAPLPAPAGAGVAFGAPGGAVGWPDEEPVWRASFPDMATGQGQIDASIGLARAKLRASQAALDTAPVRLEAYTPQVVLWPSVVTYALPPQGPGVGLPQPERELCLLLAAAEGVAPPVSFAMDGQLVAAREVASVKWWDAIRDFQSFAANLQQMFAAFTQVETRVGGQLVGWTRVTWSGDLFTALAAVVDADRIRLHEQTLAVALGTRRMSLRIAALTIAMAVKLAATSATGVGVVRLLPLLFHYLEQLRLEFETVEKTDKGD